MSQYTEAEMVTLQDISVRLMKPAKDLADWKFPLSQILEEYYTLLEEPCSINFGEAALVLQNSANVYIRRVECLFSEAEVLRQAFFGYEEEDLRKASSKEKKCGKKGYINLDNFTVIDMEKEVGKNIDKKERCQARKKIKLLSRRFTQLESSTTPLRIPICVYDIYGETIGKKYDFRCNQSINVHGMLVDELTPGDFTHLHDRRNNSSILSEQETLANATSEYQSDGSGHKSVLLNEDESEEDHDTTSQTVIEKDSFEDETENNNTIENSLNVDNQSKQTTQELHEIDETHSANKETTSIDANNRQINTSKEKLEKIDEKNGNPEVEDELQGTQNERNQKSKTSVSAINEISDDKWKLMPLNRGSKTTHSDNTSPLKLPSYLSLLKNKVKSQKRKRRSKIPKPENLTKFILRESESLNGTGNACAIVNSELKHLQSCELESFMESFDECFNGTEEERVNDRYKAVTGMAMDLLGFRLCENEKDSYFLNESNVEEETSKCPTPSMDMGDRESRVSGFRTLKSPDSACEDCFEGDMSYSVPDYRTLIEDRMKKIFDESDVTTELDTTVAKWHASLQPKLTEAELRPAFRIHDYASEILGTLQGLDQRRINFEKVVQGKPACEVARYFLASLELANTYNVEINAESTGSNMELTLLDKRRI